MTAERLTQFDLVDLIRHHASHSRVQKRAALTFTEQAWVEEDVNMADVARARARSAWGHFYQRRGMVRAFSMVLALMRRRKVSEIGAEKDTWKASDLEDGKARIERQRRQPQDWDHT